jgi:glycosyltransferase involved in cell wall biosynthesis
MLPISMISVCIPTYCGDSHLGNAIQSVLAQDYPDFELVIIDDNSPDQTASVVSRYQDDRIRYIKNATNLGPEGNWNRCLEEAQGKYFKLLPQDDVLESDCLSRQVEILECDSEHSFALVFCSRKIINHQSRVLTKRGYPVSVQGQIPGQRVIRQCIRHGTNLIGEPGGVMFRKSLAEKTGFFDGSICYIIDLDYWFRLLLNGDAYYLDAPLVSFRVSQGSWSVAIGTKQSHDFNRFIDRCNEIQEYKFHIMDVFIGHVMAKLNNFLRLVFYTLVIPRL